MRKTALVVLAAASIAWAPACREKRLPPGGIRLRRSCLKRRLPLRRRVPRAEAPAQVDEYARLRRDEPRGDREVRAARRDLLRIRQGGHPRRRPAASRRTPRPSSGTTSSHHVEGPATSAAPSSTTSPSASAAPTRPTTTSCPRRARRPVKSVSYGKEVPVCQQYSEECWQKNRRAHFTMTGKTKWLVRFTGQGGRCL